MNAIGEWDDPQPAPPPANPVVPTNSNPEPEQTNPPDKEEPTADAPPMYYRTLELFVRDFVTPVFRRRVGERGEYRWSAQWWNNAEAMVRLDAMWRSFEHLRQENGTGMGTWLREHADPQLNALMSPDGPFKYSQDANGPGDPLPYDRPPPDLFADEPATDQQEKESK